MNEVVGWAEKVANANHLEKAQMIAEASWTISHHADISLKAASSLFSASADDGFSCNTRCALFSASRKNPLSIRAEELLAVSFLHNTCDFSIERALYGIGWGSLPSGALDHVFDKNGLWGLSFGAQQFIQMPRKGLRAYREALSKVGIEFLINQALSNCLPPRIGRESQDHQPSQQTRFMNLQEFETTQWHSYLEFVANHLEVNITDSPPASINPTLRTHSAASP